MVGNNFTADVCEFVFVSFEAVVNEMDDGLLSCVVVPSVMDCKSLDVVVSGFVGVKIDMVVEFVDISISEFVVVSSEVIRKSDVSVVLRLVGEESSDVVGKSVDTDIWCSVIVEESDVLGTSFIVVDDAISSIVVGGVNVEEDIVAVPRDEDDI